MVLGWRRPGRAGGCQNIFNCISFIQLSNVAIRPTSDAHGDVAQLGEHLPCKQGVKSSNLSISIGTTFRTTKQSTKWVGRYLDKFIPKRMDQDDPFETRSRSGMAVDDDIKRRAVTATLGRNGSRREEAKASPYTKGQAKKSAGRMPWH